MSTEPPKALVGIDKFLKFAENLDYLIIGGGTAGLAVAARLSEDPQINVGVLEAGSARLNDPNITVPLLFPALAGNPDYDWDYKTIKQEAAGGKSFRISRGKVLGGTSAINWMVYARGQKEEIDDWELMGNPGWNWENLQPFYLKHQNVQDAKKRSPFPLDQKVHGIRGPISTSFPLYEFPIEKDFHVAAANSGLQWATSKDPQSGSTMGGSIMMSTVERSQGKNVRSYSANGYFLPVADRDNLAVLTDTSASKILLKNDQNTVIAHGVEFQHNDSSYSIQVKREVILCGGVFESPKLLEISGIGNPQILKAAGVDVVVESPGVGENLQDHIATGCCYELVPGELSLDAAKDPQLMAAAMKEFGESGTGILTAHNNAMGSLAFTAIANQEEKNALQQIIETHPLRTPVASAEVQRQILARCYSNKESANLLFNFITSRLDVTSMHDISKAFSNPGGEGKNHVIIADILRQPFSRGSSHITNADPKTPPRLDPAYLSHPADVKILSAGLIAADKIARTEPLASKIARREYPSEDVNLEDPMVREEYIKNHYSHEFHPVGTCAMGDVVNEKLRVKGVKGLRVVDASIIPLNTSANTQSAVYAIAEKAAHMIKEDRVDV